MGTSGEGEGLPCTGYCSVAALGLMLTSGQGCTKDEEQGLRWLRESAAGGSIYGIGALAHQYYTRKMFGKAVECAFK